MNRKFLSSLVCAAALVFSSVSVYAGGNITLNWDNDGLIAAPESPFFTSSAGTTPLPIGDIVQLITLQGGTNYVLATSTIGNGSGFAGLFDASSIVSSNIAAGAAGNVLGVKFYNATSIGSATAYGIVSNLSLLCPTPNWVNPPNPFEVEVDVTSGAWLGSRTVNSLGFYPDTLIVIPEPSTAMLVGVGVAGAWLVRRRKRA